MSDRQAVLVAAAVAAGAWWHGAVPLVVGLVLVAVALAARWPLVLALGGFALAAGLGTRAWSGLHPVAPSAYAGPVTLVADPTDTPYGVRVDVRVGDRRVELEAGGAAAGAVSRSLAGERLVVRGRLGPPPPQAAWLVPRHVVGRLRVTSAERLDGGSAPWRAANRFRRLLADGAEAMPEVERSLYAGFVLGDDRGQPPEVVDDFRGSGLTHLLVVSGQNVAFVLVLVSPLTGRSSLGARWAVTIVVVAAFGVVTRFEPSVLRASAMAALSVTAAWAGRPSGTLRLLALAVAGLVLVDPLLVRSVGFQLSVAASAGIAVLGPPVAAHLRGPAWWREAMAVTIAAQLGVAPVLVPRFGGLPVVALAANVVAVPVAGLVTTWGLPAGVVAGVAGPGVARWAHLPTRLLIAWVAAVARVSASLPLGELGTPHLVAIVAAGGAAVLAARHRPAWVVPRRLAEAVAVLVLLQPAVALHRPPADITVAGGSRLSRAGGVTVLDLRGSPPLPALLEDLRRAGVRRIDVLRAADPPAPHLVAALRHRWPVTHVVVPSG